MKINDFPFYWWPQQCSRTPLGKLQWAMFTSHLRNDATAEMEGNDQNQQVKAPILTLFPSSQRVTMTMMEDCCSQIILQKSLTVSSFGPTTHRISTVHCTHKHAHLVGTRSILQVPCLWEWWELYLELQCTFWIPCSPAARKMVFTEIYIIRKRSWTSYQLSLKTCFRNCM